MELNEKWKLTTQNNAYLWEGNQISKQNRYPCELQFKIINMLNTEYDPCMSSLISHLSFAHTVFELTLNHLKRCLSTEHLH